MSERRQDDIDAMFKKTTQPKLVIEEIPELLSFASILDNTPQGKNALYPYMYLRQFRASGVLFLLQKLQIPIQDVLKTLQCLKRKH